MYVQRRKPFGIWPTLSGLMITVTMETSINKVGVVKLIMEKSACAVVQKVFTLHNIMFWKRYQSALLQGYEPFPTRVNRSLLLYDWK